MRPLIFLALLFPPPVKLSASHHAALSTVQYHTSVGYTQINDVVLTLIKINEPLNQRRLAVEAPEI